METFNFDIWKLSYTPLSGSEGPRKAFLGQGESLIVKNIYHCQIATAGSNPVTIFYY